MTIKEKEKKFKVVFVSDWKVLRNKSIASNWFVPEWLDNPCSRLVAAYANLSENKSLFRNIINSNIQIIIDGIDKGFPISYVDRVNNLMEVNRSVLSQIIDVSPRTLSRRKTLKPSESERLFRISVLFQRALEVLGDREEARLWFTSSKKALGGKTPLEFSETEVGAREVEDLLGRIEHGVYS